MAVTNVTALALFISYVCKTNDDTMKSKRKIIRIDEELCNGCGACIKGCHEGALQLIEGKARMVSELYCDGLGACIGQCPVGAITIEEREAESYDETAVMERISPKSAATVLAHLNHLKAHGETLYLQQGIEYIRKHGMDIDTSGLAPGEEKPKMACGCPGSMERSFSPALSQRFGATAVSGATGIANLSGLSIGTPGLSAATSHGLGGTAPAFAAAVPGPMASQLTQWPVQLHLLNPQAGYFQGADVLLAADCAAYAYADFHNRFIRNHTLAIACPKLDNNKESYIAKITDVIDSARINTLTVVIMEVPCCGGLLQIARAGAERAVRKVPVKVVVIGVQGGIKEEHWV